DALVERFTALGETEPDDVPHRIAVVVEGRHRYRRHTGLPHRAFAEGHVVDLDAGGPEIDAEEIGALGRKRDIARLPETARQRIPRTEERRVGSVCCTQNITHD